MALCTLKTNGLVDGPFAASGYIAETLHHVAVVPDSLPDVWKVVLVVDPQMIRRRGGDRSKAVAQVKRVLARVLTIVASGALE